MADKVIREPQALYAVLQDKEALKRGPIFIEQDGEAAAVVLSIERYRELIGEAQPELWLEQQLARLQPEMTAYQQLLPELLKDHRGEWVAIHHGQIVALFPQRSEVIRLVQEHRYDPVYIDRVQEQVRAIDLPHVER
jgi:PHD/YefM family antitoxin component YafN of YafNO toxin-antitoxin module